MWTRSKPRAVRRAHTRAAIRRQLRILRTRKVDHLLIREPHRLAKHHALDCGRPRCGLCSNPRRNPTYKGRERLTPQELRALDRFAVDCELVFDG